jgi:hypothetical protein
LKEEAGDVGEESAFALADFSLGDEGEKLSHDAAEVLAGAKFWGAGEELVGDGLGLGVFDFLDMALVNDAEFIGVTVVRICATPSVG